MSENAFKNSAVMIFKVATISIILLPLFASLHSIMLKYSFGYGENLFYLSFVIASIQVLQVKYCNFLQWAYSKNYFAGCKIGRPSNIQRPEKKFNLSDSVRDYIQNIVKYIIYIWILFRYSALNIKEVSFDDISNNFLKYYLAFAANLIIADALQYVWHRSLHQIFNGNLYYLHKPHHIARYPISFDYRTFDMIDGFVMEAIQMIPFFLIFGGDIPLLLTVKMLEVMWSGEQHSGYTLFFITTDFHQFHHSHNIGNYGILQYIDQILGTNIAWKNYHKSKP